jgi:hypothetical protein
MWGRKASRKQSELFKGVNVIDFMMRSSIGKFKSIIDVLFTDNLVVNTTNVFRLPRVIVIGKSFSLLNYIKSYS